MLSSSAQYQQEARRRRHTLPLPRGKLQPEHQPRAMAITMSPMRWTGGVLSPRAQHQQEKTPKQPGVKARTGEDKAVAA